MTWNVAGLSASKILHFENFVYSNKYHIISVTEAELPKDIPPPPLRGYTVIKSGNGRNLVYIRDDVKHERLDLRAVDDGDDDDSGGDDVNKFDWDDSPAVWIKLSDYKIVIASIYRQFTSKMTRDRGLVFEKHQLEMLIAQLGMAEEHGNVVICGDINFDLAKNVDNSRSKLLDIWRRALTNADLVWLPTGHTWTSFGTFQGARKTSTLDHVYVPAILASNARASVLNNAMSDHNPVEARIPLDTSPGNNVDKATKMVKSRDWKNADWDAIRTDLDKLGAGRLSAPHEAGAEDVDALLDTLYECVYAVVDKHVPERQIAVKKAGPPLYLSQEARAVMKERDRAQKNKTADYNMLRNKCNNLVKRDKIKSSIEFIEKAEDKTAAAWKLTKQYTDPSADVLPLLKDCENNDTAAKKMNEFFVEKVKKICDRLEDDRSNLSLNLAPRKATRRDLSTRGGDDANNNNKLDINCIGVATLKRTLRGLNTTPALGPDGLPMALWKNTVTVLAPTLANVVNASLRSGFVPSRFKTAIVSPIYKGGGKPRDEPASYRPVAVLNSLSKLLEASVNKQLIDQLEEQGALPASQHGFRRSRSTTTAIFSSMMSWTEVLRQTGEVHLAAFDFTAAFDTVRASEVDDALQRLGATARLRVWMASYLEGGSQRVRWNDVTSEMVNITVGVRQGSILGPLVFLLVTLAIPDVLDGAVTAYADDNTAYGEDRAQLEARAAALQEVALKLNLQLNPQKTQYLVAGRNKADMSNNFTVGSTTVDRKKTIDVLGWIINDKLSPDPFLESQLVAIKQRVGVISRMAWKVPTSVLNVIAKPLVFGKLNCLLELAVPVRLDKKERRNGFVKDLQLQVNKLARRLTNVKLTDKLNTQTVLDRANIDSVNRTAFKAAGRLVWQAMNGNRVLHNHFEDYLPKSARVSEENCRKLLPLQSNRKLPQGFVNAHRIWNTYRELREAKTLSSAKTFLQKQSRLIPL